MTVEAVDFVDAVDVSLPFGFKGGEAAAGAAPLDVDFEERDGDCCVGAATEDGVGV